MLANSVEIHRVVDRAAPIVAVPLRRADACGQQNALGAGLQRYLVESVAGVFPQADYMCGIESAWTAAVYQPPSAEGQHSGTWVVGKHARVASGPPRCELRPVEERRHDPRRADRADEVGDFVVLSKVLADQDDHGEPLAELDEVENASRYVHGFPPPHRGMQLAPEVILIDLPSIQGPPMMLVLADVEPAGTEALQRPGAALLQLRRQAPVHPVVGKLTERRSHSAYPGGKRGDTVRLQQCLQRRKLILRDRALRQAHHVDAVDLVAGGDQHPVHQIQVESLGGVEFEESVRFVGIALRGTFDGAKVARAYPKRPWQQQEIDVVGARLGAPP